MHSAEKSQLSRGFADIYEKTAEQLTGAFSRAALTMVRKIRSGVNSSGCSLRHRRTERPGSGAGCKRACYRHCSGDD